MTKRNYNRRSDDQIIADLEAKISQLQVKIHAKQRPDEPVLKDLPKIRRKLASFSQLCMDHGRGDVSNSVMAFLTMLETQLRDPIE
jgi:hypothetical protein